MLTAGLFLAMAAQTLSNGIAALEGGRAAEAIRVLRDVLTTTPEDAEANFYLGLAYVRSGRPAEARPYLEQATRLRPSYAAAWKMLGMTRVAGRDTEGAARAFSRTCDLDPADPDACYYLGRTLFQLGRYEEAREPFRKALQTASPGTQWKIHRAAALNFIGLTLSQEAEAQFREAVRRYRESKLAEDDPRIDYGAFLVREGRAKEALPLLREAIQTHPNSARANAEMGKALLDSGDVPGATARFEQSLALDSTAWTVRLLLGRAYLQLGRTEEGERELRLGRQGWAAQGAGSSTVK